LPTSFLAETIDLALREVLKGGLVGVLYGSVAVGGVVLLLDVSEEVGLCNADRTSARSGSLATQSVRIDNLATDERACELSSVIQEAAD
jgi:hypothetical protein